MLKNLCCNQDSKPRDPREKDIIRNLNVRDTCICAESLGSEVFIRDNRLYLDFESHLCERAPK